MRQMYYGDDSFIQLQIPTRPPQYSRVDTLLVAKYVDKYKLIHYSTNLKLVSVCSMSNITSHRGWPLLISDMNQASLQAHGQLTRSVYLHSPKELNLSCQFQLRLIEHLYGLADAGDHWFKTLRHHRLSYLSMEQSFPDPAITFLR